MDVVIFGLSVSSSWGNGHATLWRSMLKAMSARGYRVSFYERNVPYYAAARDGWECPPGVQLRLYDALEEISGEVAGQLSGASIGLCTSYCPDGPQAAQMILESPAELKIFYDMDTPVTLNALSKAGTVSYLPPEGLGSFDLVLSYTGGRALEELRTRLGAVRVAPLYGWFDPESHSPVSADPKYACSLSYLGTYAADRQSSLHELLLRPASMLPDQRFVIAGAQYPDDFPWEKNVFFLRHLPPAQHPALFCSSRATLNVTRGSMAEYGYCPSGRLFEAAACGTVILSDWWNGLESFFEPGRQILRVGQARDVVEALSMSDEELRRIGEAARQNVLAHHTAACRLAEFESLCSAVYGGRGGAALAA